MRDISALQTLYSALIQANATILAIAAAFLTISPLRGPLWGRLYADFLRTSREVRIRLEQESARARAAQQAEGDPHTPIEFQMDETTYQLSQLEQSLSRRMEEHILAIDDYKLVLRALLLLVVFGIVVPSSLLAFLPHDPKPSLRGFFAIFGYVISLASILLTLLQLGPNTNMRPTSNRPEFINAWRVISFLSAICLLGVVLAHFLPFPAEAIGDVQPPPSALNLTESLVADPLSL